MVDRHVGFKKIEPTRGSTNDTGIYLFFLHGESGGIGHQFMVFGDKVR